jgi:hypothetical protein
VQDRHSRNIEQGFDPTQSTKLSAASWIMPTATPDGREVRDSLRLAKESYLSMLTAVLAT